MANLVDRLSTRLGRGRLRRLVPRDSHIPEQAALALPAVEAPAPSPSGWSIPRPGEPRSEEHTSEITSLMRFSYAVFCLHNNTLLHITHIHTTIIYHHLLSPTLVLVYF